MNYFSQSKGERDVKIGQPEPRTAAPMPAVTGKSPEILSTFGHGMLVTGNIVCTGGLQIFGRVTGEIHAAHLVICEGARVEGKITAQEVVIQGTFTGNIQANAVKLQATALVEGEIFNKSLTIEQNAQFEGVARRLERPVEAPSAEQAKGPAAPVLTLATPASEAVG